MAVSVTIAYRPLPRMRTGSLISAIDTRLVLRAGDQIILGELKAAAPYRTGKLRNSIVSRSAPDGQTYYALAYGKMLDEGTKPHTITARNARALHFVVRGQDVFARTVQHPGTKPLNWVRRALQRAEPAIRTLMVQQGRGVVRYLVGAA